MSALKPETFVTVVPHYWGKGESLEEALKNMRAAGAGRKKEEVCVYAIMCPKDKVEVHAYVDCQICWPKDVVAIRFTAKL